MDFSGGGGSSGVNNEEPDSSRRGKRYHRHTAHQIQRLEAVFNECHHPDEKTRNQLSRELNLHPRQIKFWFQNRRTQIKAQHERADNSALRADNDKIRCENIAMMAALSNMFCPSCGTHPVSDFDEEKIRAENVLLKEELERMCSVASRYIGRPIAPLPPLEPIHDDLSSLSISMSGFGGHGISDTSLEFDLLHGSGNSSSVIPNSPFPPMSISDVDKSLMADIAANAMDELIKLLQIDVPVWMKVENGRETLNLESYERILQSPNSFLKNPNTRVEASRDSGVVIMNALSLVNMFMDTNKSVELFPTIVSRATTIEVISPGMLGNQSGTLQLMYEELQLLSALVPTRQICLLRFCQQIEQGLWAIVNVSYDVPHQDAQFSSSCKAHRLPSGCLIQDMPNGYSKVTWVEHWEVEDKEPIHTLYKDLVHSSLAFGAERWLSALQRICERFTYSMVTGDSTPHHEGVILSPQGKRSMMSLAQRMVQNFCCSINPTNGQKITTLSGMNNEFDVRATLHDPGQPNGITLSANATIWLPIPPQNVFNFFMDERTRPQWDVLSNQNPVQEVAYIANGSHPGNCISILQAINTNQNNVLILQESCIDSSGALIVYCPVDPTTINIAMSGKDPSYIPILPSGFAISPGGGGGGGGPSTSSNSANSSSGSLITVVFQILVSNLPYARMSPESVDMVNHLISNTVHRVKAALSSTSS